MLITIFRAEYFETVPADNDAQIDRYKEVQISLLRFGKFWQER